MSDSKHIKGGLPSGYILKGGKENYKIISVLGSGGFGITYKVERLSDHKILAMKEFFPDQLCERASDHTMSYFKTNSDVIDTGIENFLTEAERLRKQNVHHPNIVAVEDVFKANNTAYYTMEYIDGHTLRQYVLNNKNTPLSVEQTLSVMRPVLIAVAELHRNKITHLDIKHDNILLTFEDDDSLRPVLIDFGQSKHYDKKGNATSKLTNAGCSDGFAPTEQYMGLKTFTPQADIYALCATMLYLLTAHQPPNSAEMSADRISGMLSEEVPENIRQALIAGMKKDKDDRTQTVDALAGQLGIDIATRDHEGNVTRLLNLGGQRRGKSGTSKRSLLTIGGIVAAFILVAVIVFSILNVTDSSQEVKAVAEPTVTTDTTVDDSTFRESENLIAENATDLNQEVQNTPREEPQKEQETVKPEEKPTLSDAELFSQAKGKSDVRAITELANKNYAPACSWLANYYFNQNTPSADASADKWANKAKAAGDGSAETVIKGLEKRGYYD